MLLVKFTLRVFHSPSVGVEEPVGGTEPVPLELLHGTCAATFDASRVDCSWTQKPLACFLHLSQAKVWRFIIASAAVALTTIPDVWTSCQHEVQKMKSGLFCHGPPVHSLLQDLAGGSKEQKGFGENLRFA